ncbi:MAG: radical SAM protein [bacterium]
MKIVLINPKPKIWIKSFTLPLGLAYVAAYAMEKGFKDIQVVDLNLHSEATLPLAQVYGITATTPLINAAYALAKKIKTPENFVVLGGPHATCLPEEALLKEGVDFVIRGEGEITFYQLLEAIKAKSDFSQIQGLSFKKDGRIIHNPERDFIKNIDTLPFPARQLFGDLRAYSHPQPLLGWRKPVVNMLTSRGCPYNCYFCYKGTFGRAWRGRSAQSVVEEWEMLVKDYKVKELAIQDDMFNLDLDRAKQIMTLVIEKKLQIPFTFPNGIRADFIDEELVGLMKSAGLYRTALGVESGVQEVLDDIGKNENLSEIEAGLTLLKKYGIQTILFFVMGNPKDTETTMQKTIEYSIKLDPYFSQYASSTPFPGTRLYDMVKASGTLRVKDWDEFSQFDQKGYFDYPHLKGSTIVKYVKKAYRKFYFRPRFIFKMLTLPDFYMKLPAFIEGLWHFGFKGK